MVHYFFWIWLIIGCIVIETVQARRLAGYQGGREVTFETTLLQSREYVNAKELLPYFPNAYNYDAVSSVLQFFRSDGTTVGIMAGDFRVVVDNIIHQIPNSSIRQDATIYIPLEVVDAYLFPQIEFQPAAGTGNTDGTNQTIADGADSQITLQQFTYSTPVPVGENSGFNSNPLAAPVPPADSTQAPAAPASLIVLDPGNDPKNPGAGALLSLHEEDYTLKICELLKKALEETQNYKVALTRTGLDEESLTNMQRTGFANAKNAAVFISIQCGAMYSRDVSRASVYFMNKYIDYPVKLTTNMALSFQTHWHSAYETHQNESYRLAQMMITELDPFFKLGNIIQLDENPRPGRLAILRGLIMPGIVIELGNLNHPLTTKFLFSEYNMSALVFELEQAISNYLYTRSGIQQIGQR